MRNLELLQHDREFLEGNEKSMVQLAHAGQQYVAEQQQRMEEELLARQVGQGRAGPGGGL